MAKTETWTLIGWHRLLVSSQNSPQVTSCSWSCPSSSPSHSQPSPTSSTKVWRIIEEETDRRSSQLFGGRNLLNSMPNYRCTVCTVCMDASEKWLILWFTLLTEHCLTYASIYASTVVTTLCVMSLSLSNFLH